MWFIGDVYGGEGRLQLVLCCSDRDEREGRSVGSLSGFLAGIFLFFFSFGLLSINFLDYLCHGKILFLLQFGR